ncbi:MAG TPA: glycosyl hydrolase [Kiritimatiellia bacterium]|nr:glycosyl hydrolase [Kiritimatiellia bacterium]HPS06199.1 glycosyl hydrolase [Kiritimatiellia bacterium]
MTKTWGSVLCSLACSLALQADTLQQEFVTPPDGTKPYMYWYWLNNNVSAKGITADLEAMKQAGVGEVFIGHVISDGIPEGTVPILSPEWWQLVAHAVREGDRIGVRVGMFNCPGWSQSGGPWMKPEQSMRYLVSAETRVTSGTAFRGVPAKHEKAIQDVALIAYPAPALDAAVARPARTACEPTVAELDALLKNGSRVVPLPAKPITLDLFFGKALPLQTLTLDFGDSPVRLAGLLETVQNGVPKKLRDIALYRTNLSTAMGPLVAAPFVFAFEPVTTDHLRLTLTRLDGKPVVRDIAFSGAARIDFAAEKLLGRMYPEPVPPVDAFLWPGQPEPAPGTAVDAARIIDLTSKTAKDGSLAWQAPADGGDWIIARIGMASTGVMCGPTPPQARGLECDKMSRAAVDAHFDGMIGEFLRRIPEGQRKGFQHITLDSYEVGPQNWTDGMAETFKKTYGYDPVPWLACLGGRVVGTRSQTDRFLWDWRRLVADLIARNYVGGLKAAANRHGLKTWLENYGHWGFPGESLQYGGAADDIGGEYWLWSSLGDVECRLATSCAHTYGKKVVSAESFTSGKNFVQTPANMKTRGDWCMAQGINHFVLHVYAHQPYDVKPGLVPWFGADFNRNSTWFKEYGKGWTDYLRRCCYLLQQGTHEADVAYFFGEDTPRMNGVQDPPLPQGYDYDYINAEVLLTRATCKNGRIVLPDGQSYRVLVLPPCETMTPRLLKKIASFVKQGLVLVGNPPRRSPSLEDYPDCDAAVLKTAADLWGMAASATLDNPVRKGRVFRGHSLEHVFEKLGTPPDVAKMPKEILWSHRTGRDFDLYFISNQTEKPIAITPEFRVTGRQPEVWDAMTGAVCETAVFETLPHATRVPLNLDPAGSLFVVFRKPIGKRIPARSLALNGEPLVSCDAATTTTPSLSQPGSFAISALVKPGKDIALPQQGPRGVHNRDQNFVVFPTHGNTWGDGHSGAGLSVGQNGVAAFEHWHQNIAPVLVWRAPAPLDASVHVALVYTSGMPALYIDGTKVHTGIASGQEPHPSTGSADGFTGLCDDVTSPTGTFSDADIAAAAKRARAETSRDTPPSRPPLTFGPDGEWILAGHAPGTYTAIGASGVKRSWQIGTHERLVLTNAAWTVTFCHPDGNPHTAVFNALGDWKDSADPRVRYFSGTALYETRFTWALPRTNTRVFLDLGEVRQIAAIALNGSELGVTWKKPFRIDITDALRAGGNTLAVRVANDWFNRFIGDEQLPDDTGADGRGDLAVWPDWVLKGLPRPEAGRVTLVNRKQVKKDTPLHPSGLLGPVTVYEQPQFR